MTRDTKTPKPSATPAISASARRFLAQLMEYCFREGWRTPDDFVKHFPAPVIMAALERAPELRVAILAAATGIYEEILRRKTSTLAAEDLALALDEGTTSSLQLLTVFSPEDRVRYLDPRQIWDFLGEDQFWRFDPEAADEQRRSAAERMSFTLMQAVQERLITLRDILDGLTYDAVADSLSPEELRTVVRHALLRGRDGIGLNEKVLLEVLPLDKLVRSMPLEHIWNEVVLRRLAAPAGLTDAPPEERRPPTAPPTLERPPSEPRRSVRGSALPPPLPPERVRSAPAGGERGRSAPPSPPPSAATAFYASEPVTGSHEATTTHPVAAAPAEYGQPSDAAPGSYGGGQYGQHAGYAQVSDYSEDDNELTTAAPPVSARDISARDNSLLPPPLAAPPSSPGARAPLTDDFNRPISPPGHSAADTRLGPGGAWQGNGLGDDAESMDRQRQRVTEHLRAIGRLPPRHAAMPASVLRSIDAMYALLPSATDDIQRKSVIRQAFANESYLRVALLGLIELMDSSVDTSDPVIQEAKIEALIKILLFEEQRRKENGRFPMTAFPGSARAPSSPPPSSSPGGFNGRVGEGYYAQPASTAKTSTQWPAPALGNGAYPAPSAPPLPNLPAEPRRRTQPPPLPPSFPRG